MRIPEIANAALALALEFALLAAAIAIGSALPAPLPVRIALAVVLPVLVVAVWAVALAPRSATRMGPAGRLVAQAVLFALAAVGLAAIGLVPPAIVLACAAAVRLTLGAVLRRV